MRGMHDCEADARARNLVRCDNVRAGIGVQSDRTRRLTAIDHRDRPIGASQTNDRFKRRAGYLGTTVNSMTRSGRRLWPGQYALPYIR